MPITLITGTPGAGKTLLALQTALKMVGVTDHTSLDAIRAGLRDASRPLVMCGVEGLQPGYCDIMEDANSWENYEDGTVFLIDEAWKWWGSHDSAAKSDKRMLALAEHRHRGFDFVLTCQMPSQMQAHLRGLVASHVHVTRKFGTTATVRYEWSSVQNSPNGTVAKNQAIESLWTHPAVLYGMYQSATQHTIKRKLPLKMLILPAVVVSVLALIGIGGYSITRLYGNAKPAASAAAGEQAAGAGVIQGGEKVLTTAEYAERLLPRFATLPASAPVYDGRQAVAEPELYCMSSEAGEAADGWREASVTCLTEQGTRYDISGGEARRVARYGTPYNHFKKPRQDQAQQPAYEEAPQQRAEPVDQVSLLTAPPVTGYGDMAARPKQPGI